jgi:hypothetical protein
MEKGSVSEIGRGRRFWTQFLKQLQPQTDKQEQTTMKLGRGINVEHIKRMTLRTVRERTDGMPETLSFLDALERNDFDENQCKREARNMMLVLEAKRKRRAAEHRSTLNFHVIRMMKGHHDPRR